MTDRAQDRTDDEIDKLVFLGFNHRVFALNRDSGERVWKWKSKEGMSDYVALLLDDDQLVVSIDGYIWALDPVSGRELWHNSLDGEGTGTPSLTSVAGTVLGAPAAGDGGM